MKRLIIILFLIEMLSCKEESISSKETILIGHWNSYESGTEQLGFTECITNSLLLSYESGISFYDDGTFGPRYFMPESGSWDCFTIEEPGTWTSDGVRGIYELKANTISLTFSPGTPDEFRRDLHLVKLDERHLWFKHSIFGPEVEHHLIRDY